MSDSGIRPHAAPKGVLVDFDRWDYSRLKNLDELERYVKHHVPTGGFLRAVLENNLLHACAVADDENVAVIPIYVSWLCSKAPTGCWGSREKVSAWLKEGRGRS